MPASTSFHFTCARNHAFYLAARSIYWSVRVMYVKCIFVALLPIMAKGHNLGREKNETPLYNKSDDLCKSAFISATRVRINALLIVSQCNHPHFVYVGCVVLSFVCSLTLIYRADRRHVSQHGKMYPILGG